MLQPFSRSALITSDFFGKLNLFTNSSKIDQISIRNRQLARFYNILDVQEHHFDNHRTPVYKTGYKSLKI